MALTRLKIDGFGQLEHNNVAYPRDGRVEAQCALDTTDFASVPAENGMLLAIDNVNRVVKFAKDASLPIGINYTSEHMYDDRKPGLKNFKLTIEDGFLPRIGFLSVADKFTTNCVCYDTTEFTDEETFVKALDAYKTTTLYGGISNTGAIKITKTKPTAGPVLLVINGKDTMPDGQLGIKFQTLTV